MRAADALVVGLAKSAVEGTVSRARAAIEEEKKLQKSVRYDLKIISDEFEMMKSFLSVTKGHVTDDMTGTLVRQVRDMALDVEDWVEFAVHVDMNPNWWRWTKNWSRRMLRSCVEFVLLAEPSTNLDIAVADIELLKARVEAMGQRNLRYSRIGHSGPPAEQPAELHQQPAAVGNAAAASDILATVRGAARIHSRQMGLSRQVGLVELFNNKKNDGALQVVSVLGTRGDLGVMSIKNAYDHPETSNNFRWRAWAKLMHPFNPREFIRCLLAQFYKNSCPVHQQSADVMKTMKVMSIMKTMMATDDLLIKDFKRQIDQNYLVVLEDVSTMVDWEAVRAYLPDKNNGSCIVVHTQQLGIATGCPGHPHRVLELEKLSADHSVYVFLKEDATGKVEEDSVDKVKTAREWLKRHPFIDRDIYIKNLSSRLTELSNMIGHWHVLSVWGMPGVGKTSLVKYIYCKKQIQLESSNEFKFGWVNVSYRFDLMDFAHNLLSDLNPGYLQDGRTSMVNDPIQGCREYLHECRGLIVIDSLRSTEEWNLVKDAFDQTFKGTIIAITNDKSVATHCARHIERNVLEIKGLEVDNAKLFNQDNLDKAKAAREWQKEHPLIGRDRGFLDSFKLINRSSGAVACVWGMCGVGKSFFVKHLYSIWQIDYELFNSFKFGWVNVSHPLNLMDFARSLLLDLNPGYPQDSTASTVKDPIQGCREYLHKRDGLIVIDGLQSVEEWDLVKAAFDGTFKGCIIVITNEESVAKYCATHSEDVRNVEGLQADHAIELLNKELKKKKWDIVTDEQMHTTLHQCGGLPKVLCAAADLGCPDNLMSRLANIEDMKDLFAWLLSYFSSSPDVIKPCIFYLSVFPLNHTIRRRRLVRRWIAEGYSRNNKETTMEEDGEMSFLKLISLSMVLVPRFNQSSLRMRTPLCQANGFFLEYINSQSQRMEDNLVFALKGHCRKNWQHIGRHLAIDETWDRDENVFGSIDFSRLRSLTVFGKWKSFFISDKMRLLRVLDLEDASSDVTNDDVKKMVKVLHNLKFLSLRKCEGITRLPESLGDLKQLQTLDIRGTFVVELPKSIIKIEKLQYIRAGCGTKLPAHDDDCSRVSPASPLPSPPPTAVASSPPPAEPEVVAVATPEPAMSEAAALAQPPTEAAAAAPPPAALEPAAAESTSLLARCSCATLVPNLLSKFRRVDKFCHHTGVKVPRGIGKLSNLHTLGVVNISTAGRKAIVEELRNLTQLHKLGVSGINKDNCQTFFSAISGLVHLESLSLEVEIDGDNEVDFLNEILPPPVRSLKLYGLRHKLPQWIKKLQTSLIKLSLQMTMLPEEGTHLLPMNLQFLRLFLSEVQVHKLHFGGAEHAFMVDFLEISCSSRLETKIEFDRISCFIKVLRIRGRHVQISGLQNALGLEQIWLSRPYDDALKQDLESEIAKYPEGRRKPIFRLEEPTSPIPWLWTSS